MGSTVVGAWLGPSYGHAMWLVFSVLPLVVAASNLRTLRTFTLHACDGDELRIECLPNTVISINLAHYGRPASQDLLCPVDVSSSRSLSLTDESSSGVCLADHALKTVESACKEQQVCKLKVSPKVFGEDPCPGIKKYAEVAYKCRPNTFFDKIVCEGDRLRLRCHKTFRIVIYSAAFGSTHYSVKECPQLRNHKPEDCQANYATETVMSRCHGRRKCSLSTDIDTFGNPGCSKTTRLFLKVVYTCVPKDTLKDLEIDTEEQEDHDYPSFIQEPTHNNIDSAEPKLKVTPTPNHSDELIDGNISTTKKADMQSDENTIEGLTDANCTVLGKDQKVIGFLTEWIAAYKFISDNKEKFILYMTVSLGAGLLAFLLVLAARLYIQQKRDVKRAKLNISEPLPLSLDEDCSDMDQYDPRQDRSVEVVRYTDRSTIRRQDSDSHPRAPLSHSMNSYYYS